MAHYEDAVRPLLQLLRQGIADGVFSCGQFEVGRADGVVASGAVGNRAFATVDAVLATPIDARTPFDLASVTKVASTTTIAMHAVQSGALDLASTLGELGFVPLGLNEAMADVPVASLLRHHSGWIDWLPFFEGVPEPLRGSSAGRQWVREAVASRGPEPGPARTRYSDLGFIFADWILERALGAPLDRLFERLVRAPLALDDTGYVVVRDGAQRLQGAATTEVVPWRGGLLSGIVHDENAWAMGGVSGHAGLFGTASDLGTLARALLAASTGEAAGEGDGWLDRDVVCHFWDRAWLDKSERFLVGWDTPTGSMTTAGLLADREATVGHLGFTGTSLWIDRSRRAYVVLLTNRVHPQRDEPRINPFRTTFNDAAWSLADEAD